MKKFRRALQLPLSDWRYLVIASLELFAARIRFAALATQKILRALQAPSSALSQDESSPSTKIDVECLSWAIAVAAQHVPWRSDCLIQVMAADRWLRRHQLRPNFYLGVAKDERGGLAAHAWLRCGDRIVTGGRSDQFSTLIEPAAE